MKKLRNKVPDTFDRTWIKFVMSKEMVNNPDTSHHKAFALGYTCGRLRQQYEDACLLAWEYDRLKSAIPTKEVESKQVLLKDIWEHISTRNVIDKFNRGYV